MVFALVIGAAAEPFAVLLVVAEFFIAAVRIPVAFDLYTFVIDDFHIGFGT